MAILAKGQITLSEIKDGVNGEGVGYVLNILGGTRGVSYSSAGTNPSPSVSTPFTIQLMRNGREYKDIDYCKWEVGGAFLEGSAEELTYTPAIKKAINTQDIPGTFIRAIVKPSQEEEEVSQTLPIVIMANADGLDWVADWDSGKTQIGDKQIVTPRIFAGENRSTDAYSPKLYGVALGKDVLGNTDETIGLVGYKNNKPVFLFDNEGSFLISPGTGGSGAVVDGSSNGLYFDGNNLTISGNVKIQGGSVGSTDIWDIASGESLAQDTVFNRLFGENQGFALVGGKVYINGEQINTGTLNAKEVNIINLNASNITSGTISSNRLSANTIVSKVNDASTTINGGQITTNSVTADKINIKGLTVTNGYKDTLVIDSSGNVTMDGTIKATSGTIGGFTIGEKSLSSTNGAGVIQLKGNKGSSAIITSESVGTGGISCQVKLDGNLYENSFAIRSGTDGAFYFWVDYQGGHSSNKFEITSQNASSGVSGTQWTNIMMEQGSIHPLKDNRGYIGKSGNKWHEIFAYHIYASSTLKVNNYDVYHKGNMPNASLSTYGIVRLGNRSGDAAAGDHDHGSLYAKSSHTHSNYASSSHSHSNYVGNKSSNQALAINSIGLTLSEKCLQMVGSDGVTYGIPGLIISDIKVKTNLLALGSKADYLNKVSPDKLGRGTENAINTIPAIEKIREIEHYSFSYLATGEQIHCGYIANQLQEIDQNFIIRTKQEPSLEVDGKVVENPLYFEEDPIIRAPRVDAIMPYVTKAIQELDEENRRLKEELALIKKHLGLKL